MFTLVAVFVVFVDMFFVVVAVVFRLRVYNSISLIPRHQKVEQYDLVFSLDFMYSLLISSFLFCLTRSFSSANTNTLEHSSTHSHSSTAKFSLLEIFYSTFLAHAYSG